MLIEEFRILFRHKIQFIRDLKNARVPGPFRGRPVISSSLSEDEARQVAVACPTEAISAEPFSIDLGKCVFCNACHFMVPGKIEFTADYRIATNNRQSLIIKAGEDMPIKLDPTFISRETGKLFKKALKLRQVSAGGDNSTEMELNAAGNVNFDMGRYGIEFVASPRHADGMVLTGPITANMAKAVELTWEAIPAPRLLILAGTDAISGGIFSGSPALDRNFLRDKKVDLYVPGNPAHPLTFIHGILGLTGRWKESK